MAATFTVDDVAESSTDDDVRALKDDPTELPARHPVYVADVIDDNVGDITNIHSDDPAPVDITVPLADDAAEDGDIDDPPPDDAADHYEGIEFVQDYIGSGDDAAYYSTAGDAQGADHPGRVEEDNDGTVYCGNVGADIVDLNAKPHNGRQDCGDDAITKNILYEGSNVEV